MVQTFEVVVVGGVLHPIGSPELPENERLRVTVQSTLSTESTAGEKDIPAGVDPLAGLARDLGVSDLAENFDDYRFGRRQL